MRLGLITYDTAHLKTEQLVNKLIYDNRVNEIILFALPFTPRKERYQLIHHRPDMSQSVPTESLSKLANVSFAKWDGKSCISDLCDIFVIGGAGVLNIDFARDKPIFNVHPGIIPTTRGLDAFKWAIFNDDLLGNTLHIINQDIDMGEIIQIRHTPVFLADSLKSLARRHYEIEIEMLAGILDIMEQRIQPKNQKKPAKMRMCFKKEEEVVKKFPSWKKLMVDRRI